MDIEKIKDNKKNVPKVRLSSSDNEGSGLIVTGVEDIIETLNLVDDDSLKTLLETIVRFHEVNAPKSSLELLINDTLTTINQLSPKDPLEQQLVIQMIITHHLFIQCSLKAHNKNQNPERIDDHLKNLNRLSNLYLNQLKAFTAYKNQGQQKVKVEHVHISDGGKAVFGDIDYNKSSSKKGGL